MCFCLAMFFLRVQSAKLTQRWQKQLLLLARANSELNYVAISKHYQGYCRGLRSLEQKALDRGFEPLMPDVWLVKHPVTSVPIILVRDEKFLSVAEDLAGIDPDCVYFTVKELIGLLGLLLVGAWRRRT